MPKLELLALVASAGALGHQPREGARSVQVMSGGARRSSWVQQVTQLPRQPRIFWGAVPHRDPTCTIRRTVQSCDFKVSHTRKEKTYNIDHGKNPPKRCQEPSYHLRSASVEVDVHPQNMVERTFAILVLIFGLVLFSPLPELSCVFSSLNLMDVQC